MPVWMTLMRIERAEMASTGLHFRALNVAFAYRFNYGLEFPSLNAVPICIRYTQQLALPSKLPSYCPWEYDVLTRSSRGYPYG